VLYFDHEARNQVRKIWVAIPTCACNPSSRLVPFGGRRLGYHPSLVWQCNALEECRDSLSVSADNLTLNLKPFQIVTIKIQTDVVTHGQ
jgi:hypothetical protein